MVYIKNSKGRLKSLKEISAEYNIPYPLLSSRYYRGLRTIEELTQPKYEMLRK